jgi:hypothetical protein
MKKLLFIAMLVSYSAFHAQVKIAKIIKSEKVIPKDEYGRVKEGLIKMKFTLSSGQSVVYEQEVQQNSYDVGNRTWQYLGVNDSKNAFVVSEYCDHYAAGTKHYEIHFFEFRYNSYSKKYELNEIFSGNQTGMPYLGRFVVEEGWSFGGLNYDHVTMYKNNDEWMVTTDKKTNGERYLTAFEMGGD